MLIPDQSPVTIDVVEKGIKLPSAKNINIPMDGIDH